MSQAAAPGESADPRILAFTTLNISDPGVDLAGSAHMHYPPTVIPLRVPCSSGIRPSWILHALESGFDGVFVAADGGDCAYLQDCTDRTAKVIERAQELMTEHGYNPRRLKMAAICSVCSESFVSHMESFSQLLKTVKDS
ncbi:MAG: hydrogenase iron-sulfur subunit [Acidobacteriota bacterium]|jgi:F420-non-reducing hydrogenase iron-sulfur subunit